MTSSDVPLEPRPLEWLRRTHGLAEEWEPRFVVDRVDAEEKAATYERMGWETAVYPHPDDVGRGETPGEHDRCVVYTRPRPEDGSPGGLVDDDLF